MSASVDDGIFYADEVINHSFKEVTRSISVLPHEEDRVKVEVEERTYRHGSSNPGPLIIMTMPKEDARALAAYLLEIAKD